jgi:hypothetical protein
MNIYVVFVVLCMDASPYCRHRQDAGGAGSGHRVRHELPLRQGQSMALTYHGDGYRSIIQADFIHHALEI